MTLNRTAPDAVSSLRPERSPGHLTVAVLRTMVERAKSRQPELAGRLEKAAAIVVLRRIEPREDGYLVESDSEAGMSYYVNRLTCTCPDHPRAPLGYCKHVLSVGLVEMAERHGQELAAEHQRERLSDERVAVNYGLAFA